MILLLEAVDQIVIKQMFVEQLQPVATVTFVMDQSQGHIVL